MSKKKVTAPLSYDPGKGRPKEYLAYLNWQEMQELMRINGNNVEFGPRGLPSFPPDDAIGSGQTPGTGNWTGSPGSGTTSGGAGGREGGGSDSGSVGGSVGGTTTGTASSSSVGSQQASSDTEAQQAAAQQSAAEAARNEALRQDAARSGINSINVGPMQNPVKIGGGQIFGSLSSMAQQVTRPAVSVASAYRPSSISPGGLASPGSIPISRAMNFAESDLGLRQPEMAEAIKQAALTSRSMFSVEGATPQQQALVDRISPTILQESITTGLDPRTILGQALTESTTSKNKTRVSKLARDANNLFGVKGVGQPNQFWSGAVVKMPTKEVINGKEVVMNEPFRKYDTPEQAVMDYSRLMQTDRYKNAAQFTTPEEQLTAIRGGGYATHPAKSYVGLGLKNISKISFGGDAAPTPASGIASLGSAVPAGASIAANKPYQERLMTIGGVTQEVSPEKFSMMDPVDRARIDALQQAQIYDPNFMGPLGGTQVAETEIENVEDQYRQPVGTSASVIPGEFNYPVKPDGTPYTEQDLAGLPPEIMSEYMDKKRFARMTDEPYPLTPEEQQRVFVTKGLGRVALSNPVASTFVRGVNLLGQGLGYMPGSVGEFGEGIAEGTGQLRDPGEAVASYLRADPFQKVQIGMRAGKPNQIPGIAPDYTGTTYAGGAPTQEPGGKGNEFRQFASYTPQYTPGPESRISARGGERSEQYYLWDLGVGIPSPGDPDYNDYQKYLRERGTSAAV